MWHLVGIEHTIQSLIYGNILPTITPRKAALSLTIIIAGNEIGGASSNPGLCCLCFTSR